MLKRCGKDFLLRKKIKSSSLSYALFTIIIIGALLMSLVILASLNNRLFVKLDKENTLIDKANSTVNLIKELQISKVEKAYEFISVINKNDARLRKKKWGVIDIIQYQVFEGKDTIQETLFTGVKTKDSISLYLKKGNKKLSLGGTVVIDGDVYAPYKDIGRVNISGYTNSIKIKGKVKESEAKLPKLITNQPIEDFIELDVDFVKEKQIKKNSFFNKTKKIIITNKEVENLTLDGNFLIQSEEEIVIRRNNRLKDIIILAPKVKIEKGFKGIVQIISKQKILLEENVELGYPSALYVYGSENEIIIEDNCKVLGAVMGKSESYNTIKKNTIKVGKSLIVGDLYCDGELEFKGELYGTIYTNSLYLNTGESEYKNTLLNFTSQNLPSFFNRLNIFESSQAPCGILKRKS